MNTHLTVPVVSAEEMRSLDRMAIEKTGIAGIVLMENAGLKTILAIEEFYGPIEGKKFSIVCGKGNNGGDGFVIARHLINRRAKVTTFMVGDKSSGDAEVNLNILYSMGHEVSFVTKSEELSNFELSLLRSGIIIDAMFGTGLKSEPVGIFREVITFVNRSGKTVVSVDIPSGLSSDEGKPMGISVRADLTVTFAFPKKGFFSSIAPDFTGRIKIVDIGIPKNLTEKTHHKKHLITPESIAPLFKRRKASFHKGNFGHVLVVAGSRGKTGAASMAAISAARAGAGLVTLAVPESLEPLMEIKTTEVMTHGLPQTSDGCLSNEGFQDVLSLAKGKSAVILGPGISTSPKTKELSINLVKNLKNFLIIDADGISAVAFEPYALLNSHSVVTPHPGEMSRLMDINSNEVQKDRFNAIVKLTSKLCINVILKGHNTLVGTKGGNIYVNTTGNPGMATGGSGDILTGILAGFISQTKCHSLAFCAAVYIHGLAGDIAKKNIGEIPLVATDILKFLPHAIEEVKNTSFKYDRLLFE